MCIAITANGTKCKLARSKQYCHLHNPSRPAKYTATPTPIPSGRPCPIKHGSSSPRGVGYCARDYADGAICKGADGRMWKAITKNGRRGWQRV